jgi:hypothetical protein
MLEASPALCLVLTPDLTIVAVSGAYLRATMTCREEILRHQAASIVDVRVTV